MGEEEERETEEKEKVRYMVELVNLKSGLT